MPKRIRLQIKGQAENYGCGLIERSGLTYTGSCSPRSYTPLAIGIRKRSSSERTFDPAEFDVADEPAEPEDVIDAFVATAPGDEMELRLVYRDLDVRIARIASSDVGRRLGFNPHPVETSPGGGAS